MRVNAAIHLPKLPRLNVSMPKIPITTRNLVDGLTFADSVPLLGNNVTGTQLGDDPSNSTPSTINMITLTTTTLVGVAATSGEGGPNLALKISSTLLFSAATGMSLLLSKIQPSHLAE
ncbi:unnamed protein product [Sphenostylis stenocarpa]|uniref:Uncharacterized protein n=1 Tax=Sphenostylis stenocarpa TaxID=92480 RepID=A0AA86VD54_9FABA|nr:unnamed protein product [Sphenostylis stenocarpa]